MASVPAPQSGKSITHIYVRDAQNAFVRPCWRAPEGLYCGMCMRGIIEPVLGAECPVCSSTVERIMEMVPGGTPKVGKFPGSNLVRVGAEKEKKQRAIVLDFWNPREAKV